MIEKTWWHITYPISMFQVWETLVIHFLTSIFLHYQVTLPGLCTSSTSSWLDRSRSIGIIIKKISSSINSGTTFGPYIPYQIRPNHSTMRSRGGARRHFSDVSHQRVKDTLQRRRHQIRLYKAVFIGPPSLRMPTISTWSAYNARHHYTSPSEMRCQ